MAKQKEAAPAAEKPAAARKAAELGMRQVQVFVKGPGAGREAALRSLQAAGFTVNLIKDVTPDRKSTRLNSSHLVISYAVFCLKKQRRSAVLQHLAVLEQPDG